jgi:hypothetical protein
MKAEGFTDEEKIEYCFRLQRDKTAPLQLRQAANRIFCSLVDVHSWLCGMANEAHSRNRGRKC